MEVFLRKHFWLFNLIVIGLGAAFLARATEHVLEASLLPPVDKPAAASATRRSPTTGSVASRSKDESKILERNIFCSTCKPINKDETEDDNPVASGPQKTSMPLRLVATAIASDPNASLAVICETQNRECGAFWIDSKIKDATVTKIEDRRVEFDARGRTEYVELESGPTMVASTSTLPPPPPTSGGDSDIDLRGIQKISETQYQIDRSLLDKLLSDTSTLARQARMVPTAPDATPRGFRVFAIRPNSLYARIGLQNGDTVMAINGYEMTSADKALEVYTKLKRASHLSVSINRRGQNQTLDYTIR